ncbi:unnamed protein product [Trichobilharzia szidati]|nr:unnamed protein product [Trichobilharzia szidati]
MDSIKPFVDSVIETALNEVQHVDVNRLKIDTNDPNFKNDPFYCETMRNLKDSVPDEPPVSVRGLVASIIQSSLYRVYEKDLLDNRLNFKVSDQDSLSENLSLDEISDEWEQLHCKPETAQEITNKIVLTDTSQPSPNIQWPTIAEFTCELGVKKIEEYIKGWEVNKNWLYCIDILPKVELKYEIQYKYRVKWSMPCRRSPIPKATASVYFTLRVSRIKPKNTVIDVHYQIETFRTLHIPGKSRFSERWLRDVINSKVRLMSYVNF